MVGFKPGMNPGATIFSGIFINQVVALGFSSMYAKMMFQSRQAEEK